VEYLLHFGRVVITTERDIDAEFLPYQIKVSPERAHSLLSFATVFIGDSQTMTSEAAVLGVPSLRCNSFAGRISYLEEEEKKYGLTYAYLPNDFESLMSRLESWMTESDLLSKWKDKRQAMLNDKIDVTLFFKTMLYDFSRDGKIKKQQWDFNLFKK
jgi:predicted glycosyltransferase